MTTNAPPAPPPVRPGIVSGWNACGHGTLKRHEPNSPESIYLREQATKRNPPSTYDKATLDALPF